MEISAGVAPAAANSQLSEKKNSIGIFEN